MYFFKILAMNWCFIFLWNKCIDFKTYNGGNKIDIFYRYFTGEKTTPIQGFDPMTFQPTHCSSKPYIESWLWAHLACFVGHQLVASSLGDLVAAAAVATVPVSNNHFQSLYNHFCCHPSAWLTSSRNRVRLVNKMLSFYTNHSRDKVRWLLDK